MDRDRRHRIQRRYRTLNKLAGTPLIVAGMIAFAILFGVPTLKAAFGLGERGVFTAQYQSCESTRYGPKCTWAGEFDSTNIVLTDVELGGGNPAMHAGSQVPALYTGDPWTVYLRHFSWDWTWAFVLPLLLAAGLLWVWRGDMRDWLASRRRSRERHPAD